MQNKRASFGLQGKATIRIGENDRGWALGDMYRTAVWAGFKATDWVSASMGMYYSRWGNVEGYDPDLDPLFYSWELTAPYGSSAFLSDPTAATPTFFADAVGNYVAQLTVSVLGAVSVAVKPPRRALRTLPVSVTSSRSSPRLR